MKNQADYPPNLSRPTIPKWECFGSMCCADDACRLSMECMALCLTLGSAGVAGCVAIIEEENMTVCTWCRRREAEWTVVDYEEDIVRHACRECVVENDGSEWVRCDGSVIVVEEGVILNPAFDVRKVTPRLWVEAHELDELEERRGAVVILGEKGEIYEELSVCFGWNTDSEQCRSCDNFEECRAAGEAAVVILEENEVR
jgi:hypothetical protein